MAEKLPQNHESKEQESRFETEKKDLPNIEKLNQEALEKAGEQPQIDELKIAVSSEAKSVKEIRVDDEPNMEKQQFGAYASLKGDTYSRTLNRIQQRLSRSERAMSKVMHNKAVEKVSDGLGKTAGRPSGILGGGIVALIGSFVLLYMTKTYGFEYNFFMFFVFLGGGFVLGVVLEFFIYGIKKLRK